MVNLFSRTRRGHIDSVHVDEGPATTPYSGFFQIDIHRVSVERFDGSMSPQVEREVFERGRSAAVLPYDPTLDRVLLIRQFLIGAHVAGRPNCPLQVIAGIVERGETGLDVARREAAEEAGLEIRWMRPAIAFMPSPGGSSERVETFVAQADLSGPLGSRGVFGLASEHENIRAEVLELDHVIDLLDAGEIEAGPAMVLLYWLARHRAALREDWA